MPAMLQWRVMEELLCVAFLRGVSRWLRDLERGREWCSVVVGVREGCLRERSELWRRLLADLRKEDILLGCLLGGRVMKGNT